MEHRRCLECANPAETARAYRCADCRRARELKKRQDQGRSTPGWQSRTCADCPEPPEGPRSLRCKGCKAKRQRAASASWAARNKKAIRDYDQQRYWSNPEAARSRVQDYRERNPEVVRKYSASIGPERIRGYYLKSAYGITLDDERRMFDDQGGKCAICGCGISLEAGDIRYRAHIDHEHDTGIIRKLLCRDCNLLIGNAHEDVDRLKAAIAYLIAHGGRISQEVE